MGNNCELRHIDSDKFNKLFKLSDREDVVSSYDKTLNTFSDKINLNYFKAPQNYSPYLMFCGEMNRDIPLLKDLSRVNMCSLDYLSTLEGEHVIVDYACGMGSFIYYANNFFKTYGFDRWAQLPKEAAEAHLVDLNVNEDSLIDYNTIKTIEPTIINIAGYWIEEKELYALDSVKYILSDPLYNSGRVKHEGVYHYKDNKWAGEPEDFGFEKIVSYVALDVYKKVI